MQPERAVGAPPPTITQRFSQPHHSFALLWDTPKWLALTKLSVLCAEQRWKTTASA
jgi:hypothetical protein